MLIPPALARKATSLLIDIARADPAERVQYKHEYYKILFHFLGQIAMTRGKYLAEDAAAGLGAGDGSTVFVAPADLEPVAYDAAKLALWRAVASAERFDPARGDGVRWALSNLGTAYWDTARDAARSRRRYSEVAAEVHELETAATWRQSPEHQVEARLGLEWALGTLTPQERAVIIAQVQFGRSYAEIATDVLGEPTATKQVDRLLQSAKEKLARAHQLWVAES